ncbi:hypothetical protein LC608_29700 [Nostoc sp. XA010]|uniref:NACHT domain-containing protein n=1 Tax=Nostoc sp. XA010 TaxID=2780407 RepID=UPI001E3E6375|nr:hypothetical protein [Nostoc sp. XA010]MCC5661069.1 hypothetical protein [Nostoc sp. XA010]
MQELSDAVLQSIIIQHGLLVERAKGIYSFSHLTFQEYFTAQIISEISEPDILKNLAIHVIEKRWREVFLLVSELRWNAGILIYYMKQTIDSLLASDEKLQFFLKWLKEKSISSKVSYKLNAIRAFYFTLIRTNANRIMHYDPELLELSIALDDTFEYAFDYEYKIIEADNYELDNDINFPSELVIDKDLVFAIEFDSDFSRSVNLSLDTSSDFSDEIRCLNNLMCKMLVSNLPLSLYRAFKLTCALNINPELAQSLVKLLNQLPHHQRTDENKQIFVEWWKVNNQIWNEKLRGAIAKYRNIGHNWQFSEHQNKLLEEYYNANKLLANCLNNGCYVSPKVRSQIEDELFLPWDEIQQSKLQE